MYEPQPKLSIGIPVYNGENFIDELLTELRHQTFQDFEIVICDNASTDRTREICERHARDNPRIRYCRNEANLGVHANFDRVFSLSRAPLFKWAAHDDLYEPTYLERCVRVIEEHPDVVGVHSASVYVDARRQPFAFDPRTGIYTDPVSGARLTVDPLTCGEGSSAVGRFVSVLFSTRMCMQIFGVFRRSALEHTRLFRPRFYGADKAVLLEMVLLGRLVNLRDRLFIKRFHEGVSGTFTDYEVKRLIDPAGGSYSRRVRTFLSFLSAPIGKPIGLFPKLTCCAAVCVWGSRHLPILALRGMGFLSTPDDVRRAALGGSARAPR